MSTFYVLPPRSFLGKKFAQYLQGLFPGLTWESSVWSTLADGLVAAASCHENVFVIYREELPEGEEAEQALANGFGAEPGDEVVELHVSPRPGEWATHRWKMGRAA